MIYTILGTDTRIRKVAEKEIALLGTPMTHIYSEQIGTLEPLIDANDLFGGKVIVSLLQVMDVASSKNILVELLPRMKDSENIFIIDEPFADAIKSKKLMSYSEKVYDARGPKEADVDVFTLCNLFAKRDKKALWVEWMRVRDLDSPEAIHGALWWKFTTLWGDARKGVPTKYTLDEYERIGAQLVRSNIIAHRGEADLKVELEKIVLAI